MHRTPSAAARQLLDELNRWQALRRDDLADTGEIGSRIDALVSELAALGWPVELRDGRYAFKA
jgi:hypothetical protein